MEDLINILVLSDGRTIILEDDAEISISLLALNEIKDTNRFSAPLGGYGGGSLLLSPSENYLVFSYFSGESEEAFALFQIEKDHLKLLYDSQYLYGEDAHYFFTNQDRFLIQTFRIGAWYKEMAQTDENGDLYYEFGEMNFFDIRACRLDRHPVLVYPADNWIEEETDMGAFLVSDLIDGSLLHVEMPWGNETFTYPLPDMLVIKFK